jgi:gluconolactonase
MCYRSVAENLTAISIHHNQEAHVTELRPLAQGLKFLEGPIALEDGSLIVCESQRKTLSKISRHGEISVIADTERGPNGAAFGSDGALYVANNGGVGFTQVDGILYTEVDGHPLRGPNDLISDGRGGFYFTDFGKIRRRDEDLGGLYYALQDGSEITEIAYPLSAPNGVGLSPDASRIYVSETFTGRLWYWDLEAPGVLRQGSEPFTPAGGTLLYGFGGYQWLDSLKVDSEGNVNVGTLITGAISTVSPKGELTRTIPMPKHDPLVSNLIFGGHDLRTAYITSAGRGILYATEWPVAGLNPPTRTY